MDQLSAKTAVYGHHWHHNKCSQMSIDSLSNDLILSSFMFSVVYKH